MSFLRRGRVVILLCLVLLPRASHATELPTELLRLVPADPIAVVVTPSVDFLERDLRALVALFDEEKAATFDPLELLGDSTAGLQGVIDTTRPAVLAVRLVQGTPFPIVCGVLGLRDRDLQPEEFRARTGMEALAIADGWVVVGEDPHYEPGNRRPALLIGLPGTDLAARLDLRAIFEQYGSTIELFLGMALATPPSTDENAPPPPAALDVEGMLELVALIRDGIRTLELAVDVEGSMVELWAGLDLDPDGPMALGAQPAQAEALDLLGRLPIDPQADGIAASALDLANMIALFELLGRLGLQSGAADTTEAHDTDRLGAALAEIQTMNWQPNAWSVRLRDEQFALTGLVSTPEPEQRLSRFVAALNALPAPVPGVEAVGTRKVGDTEVQRYRVDAVDVSSTTQLDPSAGANADAMQAWMKMWSSDFEVATKNQWILVSTADRAGRSIDELLATSERSGKLPASIAEVVRWAGPQARSWLWMDFTAAMVAMSRMAATLPEGESTQAPWPSPADLEQGPQMAVRAAALVEGSWLRGRMATDMQALARFLETMDVLAD